MPAFHLPDGTVVLAGTAAAPVGQEVRTGVKQRAAVWVLDGMGSSHQRPGRGNCLGPPQHPLGCCWNDPRNSEPNCPQRGVTANISGQNKMDIPSPAHREAPYCINSPLTLPATEHCSLRREPADGVITDKTGWAKVGLQFSCGK